MIIDPMLLKGDEPGVGEVCARRRDGWAGNPPVSLSRCP
jgi:hypothetical protein